MQVKCNWNHMATIASTVKTNNSKTPLQEAASRLIFQKKIVPWILLQIHRGNAQQVPFDPTKLVK